MCRVLTFHHFCGHVHSTHTLSCTSSTPFMSSPPACHSPPYPSMNRTILSPTPPCADTAQEPHLYPTLCDTCKKTGIISEWFAKEPAARIEAILEWRKLYGGDPERSLPLPGLCSPHAALISTVIGKDFDGVGTMVRRIRTRSGSESRKI